jgi:hypothetical protein
MLSDNQTLSLGLKHAARALADAGLAANPSSSMQSIDRPNSLADEAYQRLVLQLDMKLWNVGEKLPTEKALGESLGVSRPVIREALARLRADGRIETLPIVRSSPRFALTRSATIKRLRRRSAKFLSCVKSWKRVQRSLRHCVAPMKI